MARDLPFERVMELIGALWLMVGSILAAAVAVVGGLAWRAIHDPEPSFCPDLLRGDESSDAERR